MFAAHNLAVFQLLREHAGLPAAALDGVWAEHQANGRPIASSSASTSLATSAFAHLCGAGPDQPYPGRSGAMIRIPGGGSASRSRVAVSVSNGCGYCIASHTAAARKAGMTDAMFGEVMAVTGMGNETNRLANGYRVPIDPAFDR